MTVKAQNTQFVSVPPRASGAELHRALASLEGPLPEVQLMAAGLRFATPIEICGLRAVLDRAAAVADRVVFDCPDTQGVHAYLARMDFYSDMPPNVTLNRAIPKTKRRDRHERLVELKRIRTTEDVERLMDRVWRVASGEFGPGSIAKACATAIGATTENVVEHSRSERGALVAAQRYATSGLELAVVDLGCGIPRSLRVNPAHAALSDLEAVRAALDDGVSSVTGDAGRGAGLAELVHAIERVGTSTLRVSSGQAEVTLRWENGASSRAETITLVPLAVIGTWISVRLEAAHD